MVKTTTKKMSNKTVTFTSEHKTLLDALILKFVYNGNMIKSSYNTQGYTVYDLLHNVSDTTLVQIRDNAKKYINSLKDVDDEDITINQEYLLKLNSDIYELTRLIIRYKNNSKERDKLNNKLADAEKNLADLIESTLTPTDRIAIARKEIEALKAQIVD